MQLEFVPIEEFYFALTLAVRHLEDVDRPGLVGEVRSRLEAKFGEPSTVAAAKQNTFNYVFRVLDRSNEPAPQLVVSVADWDGKLHLSSDYGWTLNEERKPIRTEKFAERSAFCNELKQHLEALLQVSI